jgi:hypothetical protein
MPDTIARPSPAPPAMPFDLRRGIVLTRASGQMAFFGLPLAHVAAFEERRSLPPTPGPRA